MPTPNQPDIENDRLPGNDPDLTDAEKAALEGFDDDGNPIEKPPVDGADPAAAPEGAEGAGEDPAPVTTPAETPAAAAPAAQDRGTGVPFPQVPAAEARDFAAELQSLKEQFNDGKIDDDQYEAARDEIVVARAQAATTEALRQEFAEQAWATNCKAFLQRPENATLLRSKEIQGLWQQAMQMAVENAAAEGKVLTDDWEILTAGRDLLFQQMGLSADVPAAGPAAPAAEPPKPNRAPPLGDAPPSLANAPAAPPGTKETADSLADLGIVELEQRMAGMTEQQQEALLASVPGAFID